MERMKYFTDYMAYASEIKDLLGKRLGSFEVFLFGSIVRKDYSTGLSDIDIAIVSDEFGLREKRLEVYDVLLESYFDSPFEFHLLTNPYWKHYLKFIDEYVQV